MKNAKKKLSLILCIVLSISLLSSCGLFGVSKEENKGNVEQSEKVEATESTETIGSTDAESSELESTESVSTENTSSETTESETTESETTESESTETPNTEGANSETANTETKKPSGSENDSKKEEQNKKPSNTQQNNNQQNTTPKPEDVDPGEKLAKDIVSKIIKSGMSDFEKAITIHDWLTFNIDYDLTYTHYYLEETLRDRTGVCQGYALAFNSMAKHAGLNCVYITGTADNGSGGGYQGHAWNRVKINGAWYNVDVTWDDPVYDGKKPSDHSMNGYGYFLVSDKTLNKDHKVGMIVGETGNATKDYDRNTIYRYAANSGKHGDVVYYETIEEARQAITKKRNQNCNSFMLWSYVPSATGDDVWNEWKEIVNGLEYGGVDSLMSFTPATGSVRYQVTITVGKKAWEKIPVVKNAAEFETLCEQMKNEGKTEFEVRYEATDGKMDVGAVALSEVNYSMYYNDKYYHMKVKLMQL